jgi:hypothetical protein
MSAAAFVADCGTFNRSVASRRQAMFRIRAKVDKIYEIKDCSGIGVFAPQFGPRRGFFVGISQKL